MAPTAANVAYVVIVLLSLTCGASAAFLPTVKCGLKWKASSCRKANPGDNKACCWVDNFCVTRDKGTNKPDPCFTPTCPPPGFDSAANFDLQKYIAAPWYIQQQMPLLYQPVDSLYCVRAKYEPLDPNNLKAGLRVMNYSNKKRVNGEVMGTSGMGNDGTDLIAVPEKPQSTSPTAASKLLVGPSSLRNYVPGGALKLVYGQYWVVAVGGQDISRGYDWAIVSGGAPKTRTDTACRTGTQSVLSKIQINGVGLWLFTRKKQDAAAVAEMRAKATALGFDLSVLRSVEQRGCKYQ